MKLKTIRSRESRQSFRRWCRLLTARFGTPEGYGWHAALGGDIAGSAWRDGSRIHFAGSCDITRRRGSDDGLVSVHLYRRV